ncbi:hydrogenase 4 membrane subunit [Proteus sp. DFP240708]|uniref:Hydrogenase 4 membrane subunit n=3 Tax=Enterobacterales TaxID=91347 RepID=A0A6I7DAY6_9GAMM|nr:MULTISPECIES: hydrogenase 4 membrane subunit [Proteus]MBG2710136.1 hydrogenase 4 membrane subunit [Proteus mirabilis]MBG2766600.1 hydrogenase 4 membrane subunit [Proteus mirabilis]MBG2802960.1 hydrogenase 4 membrane subunit [Proteus mirabilis]MBG3019175.1 hydrogenase 4 membrane subunit [Proteus mirabilis]MBG3151155.1 hydrogenase 4 membrane subunit [Proteus mirabilis]
MTGALIVNNLAGLMMITSLLVIGAKKPIASCWFYALQSFVLVMIFVTLANTLDAHQLTLWAITAFFTKVLLVPLILGFAFRKLSDPSANAGVISPAILMLLAAVIVVLSWFVVEPIQIPMVVDLKPALAVSLGHFMLGLLCIVTQRNILKQAFGYCLMENGSHLTLALLAWRAPELVEIGIATDAIFAVIVMAVLARKIYRTLNTLNVDQLTALKG